jgi:transposase, IS5 family
VDTTVQPKAIAHPTDARLMHRALEKLVDLTKRSGVPLRQSYVRVAKRAAIMVGRYTHAHQFKRARRTLKFLRTRLGRVIRDITRRIAGDAELAARFTPLLDRARRVRMQDHRQRGRKIYSLHAPEVECIGKGKARTPYEFGCKVSVAQRGRPLPASPGFGHVDTGRQGCSSPRKPTRSCRDRPSRSTDQAATISKSRRLTPCKAH